MKRLFRGTLTAAALILAPAAAFVFMGSTGCGTSAPSESTTAESSSIAASPESNAELGVTRWRLESQGTEATATGYDANGVARIRFRMLLDSASGEVATTGENPATMHYSLSNGHYTVDTNQFLDRPKALRALTLVTSDLRASFGGEGAQVNVGKTSLQPLDLVRDGGDLALADGGVLVGSDGGVTFTTDGGVDKLTSDKCNETIKGVGQSCNDVWKKSVADCFDMSGRKCFDTAPDDEFKCASDPSACTGCDRVLGQCKADWAYYDALGCNQSCGTGLR